MATTLGRLNIVLGTDNRSLRTGLARAKGDLQKAGRQMRRIAGRIARVVGAAFAAAGVAAVKFAGDFEQEMTRLETLVGLSEDSVADMRREILRLAPAVGKGPAELSRALFAITSGGLRGAEAMETLRQAAKASAVGLGSVEQIGRTATAALQAFGDTGLTATEAIDQMVATVRAGNLRAEDLAGSLGRVMGVASTLGVRFADMNAFIATFTRLGVGAEEATTSLRSILTGLTGTNKQAAEAFEEMGLPLAEIRRQITEEGLAAGLQTMMDAAGGNVEVLSELVPNVRALSGFLGTAGAQSEQFAQVQSQVRDALGLTNDGFEKARRNLNFVRDQIIQVAKVVGIRLAQDALGDLRTFGAEIVNSANKFLLFGRVVIASVRATASIIKAGFQAMFQPIMALGEVVGRVAAAVSLALEGDFKAAAEAAKSVVSDWSDFTADNFEAVRDAAVDARARIDELFGAGREFRFTPAAPIGGLTGSEEGGGGVPAFRGPRIVGERQNLVGLNLETVRQSREKLEQTMGQVGDAAGSSLTESLSDSLKQGARFAMQSLLQGLLKGKDNILESLANIGLSIASQLLTGGLFSALGIGSPAERGIFAGRMLGEGLVVGLQQSIGRVVQAASSVGSMAAAGVSTGGVSVSGRAGRGIRANDRPLLNPDDLDPLGQMWAEVATEIPSLQRLFSAGVRDADRRGGRR